MPSMHEILGSVPPTPTPNKLVQWLTSVTLVLGRREEKEEEENWKFKVICEVPSEFKASMTHLRPCLLQTAQVRD